MLANRIFPIEVGGENYYPTFYADPDLDRRKLERISRILGELGGWVRWQLFTTPKDSLEGLTPLEALKKGSTTAFLRLPRLIQNYRRSNNYTNQ